MIETAAPSSVHAAFPHAPCPDCPARVPVQDAASLQMAATLRPVLQAARASWVAAGLTAPELDECTAAALLDLLPEPGAPFAAAGAATPGVGGKGEGR